ncbi:MAG: hypothetical protein HY770_01645 [Chitinivibrionia bacterium]|nr:hypothetical protein [Chitinivibrionia bacterium]
MKRHAIVLAALMLLVGLCGCQKKHPVAVKAAPAMKEGKIATIAVFPFTSAVHETDDPDKMAPRTVEKMLFEQLGARQDYKFVSPSTVGFAAEKQGLTERENEFLKQWPKSRKPDAEFFSKLAEVLKCDAFMIGTVDQWQKDEVDYQENASPSTYVGATITVLDVNSGEVLFQATDEDYLEGMRTETTDRQLVTGATGNVYKDMGEKMFKAPPFEDVALKVAKALASSLPRR